MALMLAVVQLVGQPSNAYTGDVAMPAPNAASLGQYADHPVSHFTGLPNISIPLYAVSDGPLSVPIGLNYHASGLRVADPASWVGAGWSLNAGGAISRTVMGIKDEHPGIGYYENGDQINNPDWQFMDDVADGDKDGEADIFTFNLPGYSGKFVFDDNVASSTDRIKLIPRQNLHIEHEVSTINGIQYFTSFTIVTPDGTKYYFGNLPGQNSEDALEESSYRSDLVWIDVTSSWHLVKVESHCKKHWIDFEYEHNYFEFMSLASCYERISFLTGPNSLQVAPSIGCHGENNSALNRYVTTNKIGGRVIKQITTSGGNVIVDFISNNIREDVGLNFHNNSQNTQGESLDIVRITSGSHAFEWRLTQDYFKDGANATESHEKKLRLTKVQKFGVNDPGQFEPPYIFDYVGALNTDGSMWIPNRLNRAIDHWGYYNYKTGNHNNTLASTDLNIPETSVLGFVRGSSDRETDENAMKNGVLKSIQYPTGGKTFFTTEANTVPDMEYTITNHIEDLQNCVPPPFPNPLGSACCNAGTTVSDYKTFTSAQITGLMYKLVLRSEDIPQSGCSGEFAKILFEIYDVGTLMGSKTLGFVPNPNIVVKTVEEDVSAIATLAPGTQYEFRITVEYGHGVGDVWDQSLTPINRKVGGLRIKEIRNSVDGNLNSNDIIRAFEYEQENDPAVTSGILIQEPTYGYGGQALVSSGQTGLVINFFGAPVVPISSFEGYHMIYSRVVEKQVGIGETEHLFNTNLTFPEFSIPSEPLQININLGQLEEQKIFNELGTEISSSNNTYDASAFGNIGGNGLRVHKEYWGIDPTGKPQNTYSFVEYQNKTGWDKLLTTLNILDGISTTTSYTYDANNEYTFPVTETITNSDSKVHETTYHYKESHPDVTLRTEWEIRNMLTPPWKTEKRVNGVLVDGSETEYTFFDEVTGNPSGSTTDRLYPSKTKRYEVTWDNGVLTSGIWEDTRIFSSYSADHALPRETNIPGWNTETLTWNESGKLKIWTFENFVKTYNYETGTDFVQSFKDVDESLYGYTYDDLFRLKTTFNECRNISTIHDYTYGDPNTGGNSIKTTADYTPVTHSPMDLIETYQYFDGLGRGIQTVAKNQGPTANEDVITAMEYDQYGRGIHQYEPKSFSANNGAFKDVSSVSGWDKTVTDYYDDPLGRIETITPPDWYATTYTYGANTAADNVTGYSTVHILSKVIEEDGQGNQNITFTDKLGRQILSRRTDNSGSVTPLDTYTEYDDKNRVNKIIPPGSTSSNTGLNYTYDYYGNDLVWKKKFPDQEYQEYRYNNRDLLTTSQDGYLRSDSKWMGYQYDVYGRPLITGFTTSGIANNSNTVPSIATADELNDLAYGTTIGYYDKVITKKNRITGPDGLSSWITTNYDYDVCRRLQHERKNNLLNPTLDTEVYTYSYDGADNVVTTNYTHVIGGSNQTIVSHDALDFAGRASHSLHQYTGPNYTGALQEIGRMAYTEKNQIDQLKLGYTGSAYLQTVDYDYLTNGFLEKINDPHVSGNDLFSMQLYYDIPFAGSGVPAQKSGNIASMVWNVRFGDKQMYSYDYDFADRIKLANSDYLSGMNPVNSDRYNTAYQYDSRGNITYLERKGEYKSGGNAMFDYIDQLTYNYSPNTNKIQNIIDAAANGTAKKEGVDVKTSQNFAYDANGNITLDPNKDIDVTYNHLNLPTRAWFPDGERIDWFYDSEGQLVKKMVYAPHSTPTEERHYIGPTEYVNSELEQVNHSYGRLSKLGTCTGPLYLSGEQTEDEHFKAQNITSVAIQKNNSDITLEGGEYVKLDAGFANELGTTMAALVSPCPPGDEWHYQYAIKDHLGNTRILFHDQDVNGSISSSTEVLTEEHYYPFGMSMKGDWNKVHNAGYDYKYNGKELHDDHGLNWYAYGARYYDPSIGRFTGVDPISDQFAHVSTYNYAENKPINSIDLHGLQSWEVNYDRRRLNQQTPSKQNEKLGPAIGYTLGGLTAVAGGAAALARWGAARVGAFLANEAKDEVLSQATGGVSDVVDASKAATRLLKESGNLLKEVFEGATAGRKTKGKTKLFEKDGGFDQANTDFDNLEVSDIKEIETSSGELGKTGRLEDGTRITVRPNSSDGRPTLEVRNPDSGRGKEIRYNVDDND